MWRFEPSAFVRIVDPHVEDGSLECRIVGLRATLTRRVGQGNRAPGQGNVDVVEVETVLWTEPGQRCSVEWTAVSQCVLRGNGFQGNVRNGYSFFFFHMLAFPLPSILQWRASTPLEVTRASSLNQLVNTVYQGRRFTTAGLIPDDALQYATVELQRRCDPGDDLPLAEKQELRSYRALWLQLQRLEAENERLRADSAKLNGQRTLWHACGCWFVSLWLFWVSVIFGRRHDCDSSLHCCPLGIAVNSSSSSLHHFCGKFTVFLFPNHMQRSHPTFSSLRATWCATSTTSSTWIWRVRANDKCFSC